MKAIIASEYATEGAEVRQRPQASSQTARPRR